MKSKSYASNNKVWLNSKYIKTKQNCKLESKFFSLFWVFYPVENQVYKLKLPKKWRIHDIFHVLLLKNNIIKKNWVDKMTSQLKFKINNKSKECKVKEIWVNAIYTRELGGHLPGLYYPVLWKGYFKEENIWEPALIV